MNDIIRQQVRLDGGNPESLNLFQFVEFLHEVKESFFRTPSEISGIYSCEDNLFYTLGGNVTCGIDDALDRGTSATSAGKGYGAVRAKVIAPVLDFEKATGPVPVRIGEIEIPDLEYIAGVRFVLFLFFKVIQVVGHVEFVSCAEYQVHPFDGHDLLCSELGVTSHDNDVGSGITMNDFTNHLSSLFLGDIGDATSVDDEYIRSLFFPDGHGSLFFQTVFDRRCFGKIQLAS